MMKKMIVITGIDGTGKSTLIKTILDTGFKAKEITIWDAMDPSVFQSKKQVGQFLSSLNSNARLLFLSHALVQAYEKAKQSDHEILIFNAYYFKYFASERVYGADKNLIASLISFFPKPDLVIELVLDEELCFERKNEVTAYECGFQQPDKESFIRFQSSVIKQWNEFDKTSWLTVSSLESPSSVAEKCLLEIEKRCS